MKRLLLAYADLRAQVILFFAEVHHHSASRIVHEAREELDRAVEVARFTKRGLLSARTDAELAEMQVRRQRQRAAMGLR